MEHRRILDILTSLFATISAAGLWHGVEVGVTIFAAIMAGLCGCIRVYDRWKFGPEVYLKGGGNENNSASKRP